MTFIQQICKEFLLAENLLKSENVTFEKFVIGNENNKIHFFTLLIINQKYLIIYQKKLKEKL